MVEDILSYKILRHIQQTENQSPTITKIMPDFYTKLTTYLKELTTIVSLEENSEKQQFYKEELQNTTRLGYRIYEAREKKIVQMALSTVRGAIPDLTNLLPDEQQFYEQLVQSIINARNTIMKPVLTDKTKTPEEHQQPKSQLPSTTQTKPNNNPILRMTQDIPEFIGTDMQKYSLRKDDILTMPQEMADILQRRKAATLIK